MFRQPRNLRRKTKMAAAGFRSRQVWTIRRPRYTARSHKSALPAFEFLFRTHLIGHPDRGIRGCMVLNFRWRWLSASNSFLLMGARISMLRR
jgi:hypothetical protein